MNKQAIEEALKQVKYPGFSRDIVSFGLLQEVVADPDSGRVRVTGAVTTADPKVAETLKAEIKEALLKVPGVRGVDVEVETKAPKATPGPAGTAEGGKRRIPGVKKVVAVASGKGGVGKSTFAVNLACALERSLGEMGMPGKVGIMDVDIYGPSVPLMLGVSGQPEIDDDSIGTLENFGVRVMSMGLLIDEDTPVVWRGPMINKTIAQFAQNVRWGELEVLVVDLPPGTGDAQLSLVQTIAVDGAVIVTTPQAAAVNVARRGALMFGKVNVPIIGVAENMSYMEDPVSGERSYVFGEGGGAQAAEALKTKLLGQVPLDPAIREGGDKGIPVVVADPKGGAAQVFKQIGLEILESLRLLPK